MPTRECNYVDQKTGFKCGKPFTVPSITYRKYRCDDHASKDFGKRNAHMASANLRTQKKELRNYLQDLKDEIIPGIQIRLLEGIHEREQLLEKINKIPLQTKDSIKKNKLEDFESKLEVILSQFVDRMDAYKGRAKTEHARITADFRDVKNEVDATLVSQMDSFSLESEVTSRFANQINMLNNRNVAYEKRITELENKIEKLS